MCTYLSITMNYGQQPPLHVAMCLTLMVKAIYGILSFCGSVKDEC